MRRLFYIVLLFLALPLVAQEEELCIDGILLYKDDFGGNDPSDPLVSTTPVQGMTYSQIFVTAPGSGGSMGGGSYLVSKEGYRNSTLANYSVWHIMDDHTYPNDKTRGYLVEIDALGSGNSEFYSTIIDGLCAGKKLTFSAYVANLTTAGQYIKWISRNYVHPKLSFIISDPVTGTELARYDTDTISHDWGPSAIDGSPRKKWQESADWQLVGMNFTVPEGVHSIRLSIRNNASGSSTGNDFAMDDIEIRLCQTPDTIRTDTTVCENLNRITWRGKEFALADTLRDTLSCSCGFDSIYYELHVTTVHCEEELCIDGTLLFREDFGGNDPSDPAVSSQNVPGMSSQYYNSGNSLGSGHYTVRKEGWSNGIQWHQQDDHTYPNDKTRGYLLEVDGKGGAEPFYSTTIDGLCAGSKLTFSAYVVNVHYAGQLDYFGGSYVYPRMKFVLKDPTTGSVLAEKSTGDIQPDWRYGTSETWKYARDNVLSAEWQLMGMNFTVPEEVESIQMFIYNDVERNGSGNDFALDDIEIHLCLPKPDIIGEPEVCENYANNLSAEITNDGTMAEPLEYKWWHSTDSITWTEMAGTTNTLAFTATQKADSGWYQVSVSGAGNIESVNCRAMSEPFRLQVSECEPPKPALCLDGILLFREDFGGNDPSDPRVGTTPVSGMSYTQLTSDRFGVMGAGKYLVTKSGYCNGDTSVNNLPQNRRSQWHLQDDHTYPNDRTRGYLLEIDARADNAAFYQTTIEHLCEGIELTFSAYVANVMTWGQYMGRPGMYAYPRLKFVLTNPTNNSELATYDTGDIPFDSAFINDYTCWQESSKWQLVGMNFTVPVGVEAIQLSIYNNVDNAIGNDFALDDIEIHLCMTPDTIRTDTTVCDTLSRITWHGKEFAITDTLRDTLRSYCTFDSIYYELHVATKHCEPPCPDLITITADTLVCDTLMPYRWRDTLFTEPATYEILYKSPRGCDSLLYVFTLGTQDCCPDPITITADTMVCDTLLPFTWIIGDKTFIFERAESQEREVLHPKWKCTDTIYTLRLDTIRCDKLWLIIVNKYNWQLLCDNVALRNFFPERTATAFQWYKNEQPISGATEDDYAEQNELCGVFQLNVKLDDGRSIWSNIIKIKAKDEIPTRVQIYNSQGMPVSEEQLSQGVYLYRYEKGDEVWVEKKWIP